MLRPALTAIVLVVLLIAAGCGGKGKHAPSKGKGQTTTAATASTATTTAAAKDSVGCTKVAAPTPKGPGELSKPKLALSASKSYTVTLETNCGAIDIALDVKRAPKTASSFASLVKAGFYDNLTFHRIVAGFVIQGGDPLGNGQGGPGYTVVEKPPSTLQYTRGIVAMAKSSVQPSGASGSQFFVVLAPNVQLPPQYALVGKVTTGMDAADRIASEPVNAASLPYNAVVIQKATIAPAP